jgi:hypothetical protein
MLGTSLDSPSRPYGEKRGVAMRPGRLHDTKPHENTAEARKRKKAERQRKKQGRKSK